MRRAKRRIQLHTAMFVSAFGGAGKCLLDATPIFFHQRQAYPKRHRSQGQMRRLAVFVAGFTPDAASAVKADFATSSIANLVARSLVILDDKAPATRWRMLETTRAYALEKLAQCGEFEVAARRHAEFFCDDLDGGRFARTRRASAFEK